MTLAHGRHFLAIPGPTTVPDQVLQAMHRPAIDVYGGEIYEISDTLHEDLRRVFRTTEGKAYIYACNGHGGWEATLSNTLSRGEKVLVLESGAFALGWGEMAEKLGCVVEVLPGLPRGGVDPARVEERLRADHGREIRAVLVVQIDTAVGVWNDIAGIRRAIDAAGHDALYMVDGVASIGCVPFEMDAWGVDVALTGSQKGLMTPPGLAMVAAGPRARARHRSADLVTRYWDWTARDGEEATYMQYCGTPPEHLLFALRRALDMLLVEEGLEAAWRRHAVLAEATRRAVAAWTGDEAGGGAVWRHIAEPSACSDTVTLVRCAEGVSANALRNLARDQLGVTLGANISGFGGPDGGFRIAHMGHANAPMMLGTLGAVETAMTALGWPIGGRDGRSGVAAAAAYCAEALNA